MLILKHPFQNMKFRLIFTTCLSFFLFLGISFCQENTEIKKDSLKYLSVELNDGSKVSGLVISLDDKKIILLMGTDTLRLPFDMVKSFEVNQNRKKANTVVRSDFNNEQLHYYSRTGFNPKSSLIKSNLIVQNSADFKIMDDFILSVGSNIFAKGVEVNAAGQINYGKSKFFHPYSTIGTVFRFGFLSNNAISFKQGFSLGSEENHLTLEAGLDYSPKTNSILGLNYRFGFLYKVGSNLYLFMEHQKSALGLIKYHNSAGFQFRLKSLNGQIGMQNIYTNTNLHDSSNIKGSLYGPLVRIIKPIGK